MKKNLVLHQLRGSTSGDRTSAETIGIWESSAVLALHSVFVMIIRRRMIVIMAMIVIIMMIMILWRGIRIRIQGMTIQQWACLDGLSKSFKEDNT